MISHFFEQQNYIVLCTIAKVHNLLYIFRTFNTSHDEKKYLVVKSFKICQELAPVQTTSIANFVSVFKFHALPSINK